LGSQCCYSVDAEYDLFALKNKYAATIQFDCCKFFLGSTASIIQKNVVRSQGFLVFGFEEWWVATHVDHAVCDVWFEGHGACEGKFVSL
jgi:hypothetical protein